MMGLKLSTLFGLTLAVLGVLAAILAGIWTYGQSQYSAGKTACKAEFKAAADNKNLVIGEYNDADAAMAAIEAAALQKAREAALLVAPTVPTSSQAGEGCGLATEEQATALSAINRPKRRSK